MRWEGGRTRPRLHGDRFFFILPPNKYYVQIQERRISNWKIVRVRGRVVPGESSEYTRNSFGTPVPERHVNTRVHNNALRFYIRLCRYPPSSRLAKEHYVYILVYNAQRSAMKYLTNIRAGEGGECFA